MTNELIEYLKEKAAENVNNLSSIRLLNNNDYSFEAIFEAKNCDIKIHESTRQFQLFISKKDNNWISMYWVAKYLEIPYQIFTIEQLSGTYDEILKKQIDYICSFIKNYIEVLDSFYGKNIDKDILKIQGIIQPTNIPWYK